MSTEGIRRNLKAAGHVDNSEAVRAIFAPDGAAGGGGASGAGMPANHASPSDPGAALCMAAYAGDVEALKELLDSGMPVPAEWQGSQPHHAAARSSAPGAAAALALLLGRGADMLAPDIDGLQAIHRAAAAGSYGCLALLVKRGASVHARDPVDGARPIHFAAASDSRPCVSLLQVHGADIEAEDSAGLRPVHYVVAAHCGDPATAEDVLYHLLTVLKADPDTRNAAGRTALRGAIEAGCLGMCERLIARGVALGDDAMWAAIHAVQAGSPALLRLVLAHGGDPNAAGRNGRTPLHHLASTAIPCLDAVAIEMASLLLDRGADIEALDTLGWRPLHTAANRGRLSVLRLLLDRGADVEAATADRQQQRALHRAALDLDSPTARLLLERGADPNAPDGHGMRPLHTTIWALGKIDAGCLDGAGAAALIGQGPKLLLQFGAATDLADDAGWLPLHRAACMGDLRRGAPFVELLLRWGAAAGARLDDGRSALHLALITPPAGSPGGDVLDTLVQTQCRVVQLLLAHGADPNASAPATGHPVELAVAKGPNAAAQCLLSANGVIITRALVRQALSRPACQELLSALLRQSQILEGDGLKGDRRALEQERRGAAGGAPRAAAQPRACDCGGCY